MNINAIAVIIVAIIIVLMAAMTPGKQRGEGSRQDGESSGAEHLRRANKILDTLDNTI